LDHRERRPGATKKMLRSLFLRLHPLHF
jgi:hypothetical protein